MKIAVLTSGGVDSAVALQLLQQAGHDVTAFYLKIWLEDELAYLGDCPWQEDLSYVQAVCAQINVPLEVISLQKEYQNHVVAYVIEQVKMGNTPNPDILCNSRIKFGMFVDAIDDSYEKVATGHYAQVIMDNGVAELHISPDAIKDQTYFLSGLSQAQLQRALFPIGGYTKAEVRQLAESFDLPNKQRKDSQGICFLGTIKFRDFIQHHVGQKLGNLVEFETGEVVGQHQGFWFYTVGQRQGLGLAGGPWYVVSKDISANKVFISRNYYSQEKIRDRFTVGACHWFSGSLPQGRELTVKLRHGATQYACQIIPKADSTQAHVIIAGHDQGIAAGQFAVFYDKTRCVGSAVIQQEGM